MLRAIRILTLSAAALALAACSEDNQKAGADRATAQTPVTPGAAASAATPAAATDWSATVVQTPEGGFRMGNPDAPVKLLEFASFTCTHCQRFHLDGADALKTGLVKSGQVSYEFRPFLLNAIDIAATMVAVCNGPEQFFTWADQLFRNHDAWVTPFTKLSDADLQSLNSLAQDQQVKRLAELGGLDGFVRVRGMPRARFDQCVGNGEQMKKLMANQQAAMDQFQVNATPTLVLNGTKLEGVSTWEGLRPKIEAALS
jgi:protein-disulfide isomerase